MSIATYVPNVTLHNPAPTCPSLCYYDNLMGSQDYYSHQSQDDALDGDPLDLYDLIEEAISQ